MKKVTITYNTYKFDELKEEARERAMNDLCFINVEGYKWYEFCEIEDIAKKYGLEVVIDELCFDLDRDNFCYFETYNHGGKENYVKGIQIVDYKKFFKKAGITSDFGRRDISIDHTHFAGSAGHNIISCDGSFGNVEIEQLESCLDYFCEEVLSLLKKQYACLTTEKSILGQLDIKNKIVLSYEYNCADSGTAKIILILRTGYCKRSSSLKK